MASRIEPRDASHALHSYLIQGVPPNAVQHASRDRNSSCLAFWISAFTSGSVAFSGSCAKSSLLGGSREMAPGSGSPSPPGLPSPESSSPPMTIVIGILVAQIVNWLIADRVPDGASAEWIRNSWNGQVGWRLMFEAVVIPSVLFFVSALLVTESPRWLISHGKKDLARAIFARIGGASYALRTSKKSRARPSTLCAYSRH